MLDTSINKMFPNINVNITKRRKSQAITGQKPLTEQILGYYGNNLFTREEENKDEEN